MNLNFKARPEREIGHQNNVIYQNSWKNKTQPAQDHMMGSLMGRISVTLFLRSLPSLVSKTCLC